MKKSYFCVEVRCSDEMTTEQKKKVEDMFSSLVSRVLAYGDKEGLAMTGTGDMDIFSETEE